MNVGDKLIKLLLTLVMLISIAGCSKKDQRVEIQVFIAASLNNVMQEVAKKFNQKYPDVKILYNVDSSGTLMTQIQAGYECDIFFSAASKQMDNLEKDGLLVNDSRVDLLNNQVVLIALKNSNTKVNGLMTLNKAQNMALASGSVPVGKYTREALVNLGLLEQSADVSKITTSTVAKKLGNIEISEQDNVSKVLIAVLEGNCEVGTVYYSDLYGYKDKLQILEEVNQDLTGNVVYPVARVKNKDADAKRCEMADIFFKYLQSDETKEIFKTYYFDPDFKSEE